MVRDDARRGTGAGRSRRERNKFAAGDGVLARRFHLDGFIRRAGCPELVTVPADGSTDRVHRACMDQGFEIGDEVRDIGSGRFFRVRDPDGFRVTIDEQAAWRVSSAQ